LRRKINCLKKFSIALRQSIGGSNFKVVPLVLNLEEGFFLMLQSILESEFLSLLEKINFVIKDI